jgi:hypothetical protein
MNRYMNKHVTFIQICIYEYICIYMVMFLVSPYYNITEDKVLIYECIYRYLFRSEVYLICIYMYEYMYICTVMFRVSLYKKTTKDKEYMHIYEFLYIYVGIFRGEVYMINVCICVHIYI